MHLLTFYYTGNENRKVGVMTLALALVTLLTIAPAWGDLDVNAVAGRVTIDGQPAPSGTVIRILDTTAGSSVTTTVDGANVPPFEQGDGRYDTGDVPSFSTGDTVMVSVAESTVIGQNSGTLSGGTTTVNLNAHRDSPPEISPIPAQEGFEDLAWELDIDPYISDPDTSKSSLSVIVQDEQVTVEGHVLTFLYPQGILDDVVTVYVRDGHSTVSANIQVTVNPVNDPPSITEMPRVTLLEGAFTCIDLSPYVSDPDDQLEDLTWSCGQCELAEAELNGSLLSLESREGQYGTQGLFLSVSDPGGMTDNATLEVKIEANVTALVDFYEAQIQELEATIGELNDQNGGLSQQIEELQGRVADLEQERDGLNNLLSDAEAEASQLQAQVQSLMEEADADAETIENLESQKDDLEIEVSKLRAELNATISQYQSVISELNSKKMAAEEDVDELSGQIGSLNDEIERLESLLDQAQSNLSQREETISNLTSSRDLLAASLQEREGEIEDLQQVIEELQSRIDGLEEQKEQAMVSLEQVTMTLESARANNTRLQDRIQELSTTSPARLVEGNRSTNTTQESHFLRDLVAKGAHVAHDSIDLVSAGMNNVLVILVVGMIVVASAVALAARTSWVQMGVPTKKNSAEDYWSEIQSRAMEEKDQRKLSKSGQQEMVEAKEEQPEEKPLFVTRKPGLKSAVRKKRTEKVEEADYSPGKAEKKVREEPEVSVKESGRKQIKTGKEDRRKSGKPEVQEKVKVKKEPEMDLSSLSDIDRQYVESLLELGFVDEAREELRKRKMK